MELPLFTYSSHLYHWRERAFKTNESIKIKYLLGHFTSNILKLG